ncbi:hypothetical protein EDD85DRAFT_796527 [Armillaria nabsnona]|nr:hypothetical protein EDD85DRAFT_796527 [Armillaria nabsnona]
MLLATSITLHPFEWHTAAQGNRTVSTWESSKAFPGWYTERAGCRHGGWAGTQGVPQEARMSRGPVTARAGVLDKPWIHQRTSQMCIYRTWIIIDPVHRVCVSTFVINGRVDTADDFVIEPTYPTGVVVQITQSLDS